MAVTRQNGFDLAETYVKLGEHGRASPVPAPADLRTSMAQCEALQDGRLMRSFRLTEGVTGWEQHPAGEELLVLMSGAMDVILDEPGGERIVTLRSRDACMVPQGVWHRQIVHTPSDPLWITPGAGTEYRPA